MNEMNEFLERHELPKLQHPCVGADGSLDELSGLPGRGMGSLGYILEVGALEFADELDMGCEGKRNQEWVLDVSIAQQVDRVPLFPCRNLIT